MSALRRFSHHLLHHRRAGADQPRRHGGARPASLGLLRPVRRRRRHVGAHAVCGSRSCGPCRCKSWHSSPSAVWRCSSGKRATALGPHESHVITLIPGDGIGPEVTDAVVRIIEAAGVDVTWERHDAGVLALEKHGTPLPDALARVDSAQPCRAERAGHDAGRRRASPA